MIGNEFKLKLKRSLFKLSWYKCDRLFFKDPAPGGHTCYNCGYKLGSNIIVFQIYIFIHHSPTQVNWEWFQTIQAKPDWKVITSHCPGVGNSLENIQVFECSRCTNMVGNVCTPEPLGEFFVYQMIMLFLICSLQSYAFFLIL